MWRGEARDRAARYAAGSQGFTPVAGDLENRLEPVRDHFAMGIECHDAPDCPSFAVICQRLCRDGNGLGPVCRSRCHREHENIGARSEERASVALAHLIDVRFMTIVTADRNTLSKVGRGFDLVEIVVSPELAIGVLGYPGEEKLPLHVAGIARLFEKRLGETP